MGMSHNANAGMGIGAVGGFGGGINSNTINNPFASSPITISSPNKTGGFSFSSGNMSMEQDLKKLIPPTAVQSHTLLEEDEATHTSTATPSKPTINTDTKPATEEEVTVPEDAGLMNWLGAYKIKVPGDHMQMLAAAKKKQKDLTNFVPGFIPPVAPS